MKVHVMGPGGGVAYVLEGTVDEIAAVLPGTASSKPTPAPKKPSAPKPTTKSDGAKKRGRPRGSKNKTTENAPTPAAAQSAAETTP